MKKEKENELDSVAFINSTINEIYAVTEVRQSLTNRNSKEIKLNIHFPIKIEIQLSKYILKKGNKQ